MTTEYFRVRNGLAVGEDKLTVDAATGNTQVEGNLVVTGDLTINGTTTTLNTDTLNVEDNEIVLNSNVTGTPSLDAAIIINRGDSTDSSLTWNETADKWYQNRAGTSTVIPVNTTELTEGDNLYYTDTRARASISVSDTGGDGSLSYDNGTGVITYTGASASEVRAHFSAGTGVTITDGQVAIGQSVGITDDVVFDQVTATNLVTSAVAASSGDLTLSTTSTGNIVLTLADGGNLTNSRNYVFGAIRNTTTDSIGDIWASNSTGPVNPMRGVSLDNSADTTRGPATLLRSYTGSAAAANGTRGRLIFERARGTAASPSAVQLGDVLGSIDATGYTSTGWVNDNIAAGQNPAFFGFTASENWVSNTNLGSQFILSMAPTATTITGQGNLVNCIQINPQVSNFRTDNFAIGRGKTSAFTATGCSTSGTTLTIGTVTSGSVAVGQLVQTSITSFSPGIYIVSGSGSTWTLSATVTTGSSLTVTGVTGYIGGLNGTTVDALSDLRLIKNTIKGSGGTTQITTSSAGATLALAGDTTSINLASGTTIASFSDAKIFNNRPHRSALTTATMARGGTYTPAAGVNNFIELTLTTGTDPTYIDVDNLTVAGEGGHQAILVYNNSGSSIGVGDLRVRNNGTQISDSHSTVANGQRAIFTVYCIGNYASCEFMSAA